MAYGLQKNLALVTNMVYGTMTWDLIFQILLHTKAEALVWSNIWKIRCVKQKMELVVVVVVVLYKLRGNENT